MNEKIKGILANLSDELFSACGTSVTHISVLITGAPGILDLSQPIQRVSHPPKLYVQHGHVVANVPLAYSLMVPNLAGYKPGQTNVRVDLYFQQKRTHSVAFSNPDRGFDMVTEIVNDYSFQPGGPYRLLLVDVSEVSERILVTYDMSDIPLNLDEIFKTYNCGL